MPFPSLISLVVWSGNQDGLQGYLESFFKFSPNIRRFSIDLDGPDIEFCDFFSRYICQWRDLHAVYCNSIALDVDALAHLSGMPTLTELSCTPSATFPPSDSPLVFSNLHRLILNSEFLDPISMLLCRIRLPATTSLIAYIDSRPSKQSFSSFLASVQESVIDLSGMDSEDAVDAWNDFRPDSLGFEDLRPCMAFSNLHYLDLGLSWDVYLTDDGLLALASVWPHLEHLFINQRRGWGMADGITPNGLLRLLQTCLWLRKISLAINVDGYTEFHESPASLGLNLPPSFSIDVLDSFIEEENVPAIAAFLAAIAPRPNFSFYAYDGSVLYAGRKDYSSKALWYEAYRRANVALSQRS
ncbi:hypothetical protein OG21DRAFT_1516409 [Imleria badia]|nr:hypothetical protein OG21DRAFT_1516409 [Imleria badia]